MRPFSAMGDDELGAALRAIRPEPGPAFAAELDRRAAAGFPRPSPRGERAQLASLLGWLRASRWRLLIPVGGVAVAAIAVATVILVGSKSGGGLGMGTSGTNSATSGGSTLSKIVPFSEDQSAGAGEAAGGAEVEGAESGSSEAETRVEPAIPTHGPARPASAAGSAHREVERAASIVIGTEPGEVGEASAQVFEAVHRYDGIVLDSSTQNGSGTQAEASFELLIPSGKVGDAMAAFSRIGEVVNRHESTNDITAPTVGASERLQDSEARIEGLLAQLSETTTESEREVVEAELDSERRHAAHLRSHLTDLKRRANLSHVSVRIVSGKGALTPGGSGGDEGWGVGSALGDAGRLLSVAAGVTIVGFAVLAPLLLLALLAWLAGRVWTRRARERALT